MKKRVIAIISFIIVLIITIGGVYMVQNVTKNKDRENWYIQKIYTAFVSKEYVPRSEITVDFLKKHPLPLKIDGASGLYIKTAAYFYYTGNNVDYSEIERLLNEQKYEEICTEYKEFMDWLALNKEKPIGYFGRLAFVSNNNPEFIAWNDGNELDEKSSQKAYEKAWELCQDEMYAKLNE